MIWPIHTGDCTASRAIYMAYINLGKKNQGRRTRNGGMMLHVVGNSERNNRDVQSWPQLAGAFAARGSSSLYNINFELRLVTSIARDTQSGVKPDITTKFGNIIYYNIGILSYLLQNVITQV